MSPRVAKEERGPWVPPCQHRGYASRVARKILWASLALAPITFVADFVLEVGDVALFVLASIALIPLAWLIGEATEHAAQHTGAGSRRLPERDVRQRSRADHLAARDQQRTDGGRARLADGKRRRQPAARSRLLAPLRPRQPVGRPCVELHLARADPRGDDRLHGARNPRLARRPGAALLEVLSLPVADRPARPLRRRRPGGSSGGIGAGTGRPRRPRAAGRYPPRSRCSRPRPSSPPSSRRSSSAYDRDLRREGSPLGLLRRRSHRRDRRQRGGARWCHRRRPPGHR